MMAMGSIICTPTACAFCSTCSMQLQQHGAGGCSVQSKASACDACNAAGSYNVPASRAFLLAAATCRL
jgi:hypothetical protein